MEHYYIIIPYKRRKKERIGLKSHANDTKTLRKGEKTMFYGEYKHTIDAKGRLFIPAKLREKLGDSFILSRGFDKCVCVYPEDEWERFTAKIEELPFAKERRVRRYFYAYSEDGSIDAQGRVTVNKDFREFASLEKDVVIIGNRNHFEIWSAAAWEEEKNAFDNEDITNELIELGF